MMKSNTQKAIHLKTTHTNTESQLIYEGIIFLTIKKINF